MTTPAASILWLGDAGCDGAALVGGKAASLSRLAARYPVPPGFAITALPATAGLDAALSERIARAYADLGARLGSGAEPMVAVRSSAVDEDSAGASFAGQHATYLNICGPHAVLDAVQRCLRSALSAEATTYRASRGLAADDVRIAVLVQALVPADVALVAFSANPITGDRGELMITSAWGLGESIVGGTTTPDLFTVRKDTMAIVERALGAKERMTVRTEGGTDEVDTPAHLSEAWSLTDQQVVAVGDLVVRLEADLGYAVDVECAFAQDSLYLLQCRPITTLG